MNNSNYYSPSYVSQHSLVLTFAWMTLGLLITGIVSTVCAVSGIYYWMIVNIPVAIYGLLFLQIGLTFAIGAAMRSASATFMKVLFLLYATTFGISLSSLAYAYGLGTISIAFFVSAAYFICLAIVGLISKRDFSRIGSFCIAALIALIVTQLILALFGVSMNERLICFVGLLIFTGITIFDVQRATQLLTLNNGDMVTQEKISIYLALQLYLDFINIFLYILRLLGSRKK